MTITTFIIIATICCAVSVLLTEGIKAWCKNANKTHSANLIALINAFVAGGGGTAVYYVFNEIPFTLSNNICIGLMILVVWLGSMIGYDKVMQLISQISTKK